MQLNIAAHETRPAVINSLQPFYCVSPTFNMHTFKVQMYMHTIMHSKTCTDMCIHAHIHTLRAKCRGLLLACCSCAVACGPVCRADRWSFTASPGLSVEFTGRGRQFIRAQRRERAERGQREKERGMEGERGVGGVSMKMEGKIWGGRWEEKQKERKEGTRLVE